MESLCIVGQHTELSLTAHFREHGYRVEYYQPANVVESALDVDVCLLDFRGSDELAWSRQVVDQSQQHVLFLVLVDAAQKTNQEVIDFITNFAWDYHTAPIDIELLTVVVGHMMGVAELKRQSQIVSPFNQRHRLPSALSAMQQVNEQIERVAPTGIPVLIRGDSGTGKERIAFRLHNHSNRKTGPFIAINCGAINAGLAQSDLFGHEKGAFTGASIARKGKISQAHGGTLFLDEIGDLPMAQQANLLRFLQEGQFDVLGGSQVCEADVRIVAATHVDLEQAIAAGKFRLDLFYRLNGITLHIPSLRERRDDILPLAQQFISQYSHEFNLPERYFSREAKQALLSYSWPGNVREMLNCIRRAVVLCEGNCVGDSDLDLVVTDGDEPVVTSLKVQRDNAECLAIKAAIKAAQGKVDLVANKLQISRATLYRLLDKHQLPRGD